MTQFQPLPFRRPSIIEKIPFGNRKFHVGFGFRPETATIAEIWIDGPKAGSHEQAALHDASAVVSIALQHGIPVADLARAVDAPGGEPVSVLGAVLRTAREIEQSIRENDHGVEDRHTAPQG